MNGSLDALKARMVEAGTATEQSLIASEVLGSLLGATRAGYALADVIADAVLLEGLWGSPLSHRSIMSFADFGACALKLGEGAAILVGDLAVEAPGVPGAEVLRGAGVRAFIIVPVHERNRLIGFMFVQSGSSRTWDSAELALVRSVAEIVRDIRAQTRAESRGQESDRQSTAASSIMPIQIFAADNYGMRYWHNRRVLKFTGADAEDLDGFGYQNFIHPEDLRPALRDWYAGIARGTGHSTEFRARRADGEYRWFVCRSEPMHDEHGQIVRYLGTNTDIHDLKCAQIELARLNHDLEAEVTERTQERDLQWKTSSDLMAVTAPKLESFRVNPAWETMLGWSKTEILAFEGVAFIHPDDRQATFGWLAELEEDGDRVEFENRLLRKDGGHVWLSWIVTRHGTKNYSTGRDITMTRNLMEAQQDLAHASRVATLGELTASIAHELSQPLAAVTANAQAARRWIGRPDGNAAEAIAALDRVVEENKRAGEIITRIRDMAVRGRTSRARTAISPVISDSIAIVQSQVRLLGAAIVVVEGKPLSDVLADRVQLQQVLTNLLLNAAQAMARAESSTRMITVSTRENEGVTIRIEDTGPGVPDEAAVRVFNAFYTTRADGMGMGLSIAKYIVEAHGGELKLESNGDYGAAFEITLSAMPSAASVAET